MRFVKALRAFVVRNMAVADHPPALVVADASVVAKGANIVITVVAMQYSTNEQTENCVESLREFNKNVKSFILVNKVDSDFRYKYNFGFGYGYVEKTIKD